MPDISKRFSIIAELEDKFSARFERIARVFSNVSSSADETNSALKPVAGNLNKTAVASEKAARDIDRLDTVSSPAAAAVSKLSQSAKVLRDRFDRLLRATARLPAQLKLASVQFERIQKSFSRLNTSLAPLLQRASRAGVIIAALAGAASTGIGFKLAADLEKTSVSFETLIGDAQRANQVLKDLQQFAASTPFQFTDLIDASQVLLTSVEADKLVGTLQQLGDVAAGTGSRLSEIAQIYAKTASTGRVTLETVNQLAERGVPIYDELSTQLGVTRAELLDLVSTGAIGFSNIETAFVNLTSEGGKFNDLMVRQSATAGGLFSTFRDNVAQGLTVFFTKLIPIARNTLSSAITAVQQFNVKLLPRLADLAEQIFLNVVVPVGQQLLSFVPTLLEIAAVLLGIKATAVAINIAMAAVGLITTLVAALTTPVGIIVAGLGVSLVAIADIGARLVEVEDGVFGIAGEIRGVFKDLLDGTILISEIFQIIEAKSKIAFAAVNGFLLQPVIRTIKFVKTLVEESLQLAFAALQAGGIEVISFITTQTLAAVRKLASLVDGITSQLARVVAFFDEGLADSVRTALADAVPENFESIEYFRKQLGDNLREASADFVAAVSKDGKALTSTFSDAAAEIKAINSQLEADLIKSQNDRLKLQAEANKVESGQGPVNRLDEARRRREAELQQQLQRIRESTNREATDKLLAFELQALEASYDERRISTEQYLAERERLELTALRKRATAVRSFIEDETARSTALSAIGESTEQSLSRLVGLELELQSLTFQEREILTGIAQLRKAAADAASDELAVRQQLLESLTIRRLDASGDSSAADQLRFEIKQRNDLAEAVETLGKKYREEIKTTLALEAAKRDIDKQREEGRNIITRLRAAQDAFNDSVQTTNALLETGSINSAQALQRIADATQNFKGAVDLTQLALIELATTAPPLLAEQIQVVIDKLDILRSGFDLSNDSVLSFRGNLVDSFEAAITKMDELGELGSEIGATLGDALSNGLTDSILDFADGTKSASEAFRDFALDTLKQILRLIIQYTILNAVSGAFGFSNTASAASAASTANIASTNFYTGGRVYGAGGIDNVPANLTRNEFVHPISSTSYYGFDIMEAIRRRLIPRSVLEQYRTQRQISVPSGNYNAGGRVSSPAVGTPDASPNRALVVGTDNSAEQLMQSGGRAAILRMFENDRAEIKARLGL